MSTVGPDNLFPDETLALANAIAFRSGQTDNLINQVFADLEGLPYEAPSPEELRGVHIGRTVLSLARIENPDMPVAWSQLVDIANSEGSYEVFLERIHARTGVRVEAEAFRNAVHAFTGELLSSNPAFSDEKVAEDFARLLTFAREVAAEHDVNLPTVYETDDLYYEASRRAFDIVEAVDELASLIDGLSADAITKLKVQQVANFLPKELLDVVGPEGLMTLVVDMQLDPENQAKTAATAETSKEALRQVGTYILTRTFGANALNNLSAEHRFILKPRRSLVASLFDTLN